MTRVKGGTVARARRKKVLKEAKGYFGSKHRLYRTAHEQLMHSGQYAFRDRRQKKREFRKLWIARINAACKENEITYSRFINGLTKAGVTINRKMLSEVAIDSPETFKDLVVIAKDALNGKTYTPKVSKAEAKKEEVVEVKAEKKTTAKKTTTTKAKTTKSDTEKKTATKKTTKKEEK
jgi:large subunit ribosomal protein L20